VENKTDYLYICLDTGIATFVKHDVTQGVKKLVPMTQDVTFKIGKFSSGSNITELIIVTGYASY